MKLNTREIEAVSKLSKDQRYEYFLKKVADWEKAWGLSDDGWALYGDASGVEYFPLWPAQEYAAKCATGEWKNFKPAEISLEELRGSLLQTLGKDGVQVAVFMVPDAETATLSARDVLRDLNSECEKYE